jgi:hypothetical protein
VDSGIIFHSAASIRGNLAPYAWLGEHSTGRGGRVQTPPSYSTSRTTLEIHRLVGRLEYPDMRTARSLPGRAPHLSPIRLTGVKTMTIRSALPGAAPACAAVTSNDITIPAHMQPVAHGSATSCAAPTLNTPLRLALLVAGLLLAVVSIALAASAGWSRGASQLESAIWAAAGTALAIVSLTGLSAALASSGTTRRAAFAAWGLSLAFVVVAGLGSQHGGREAATRTDNANTGDRARHEVAYKLASDQLAALPAARPVGVIATELGAILKDTRLGDCRGWLESKRLRTICVERVEPLRNELATAEARAKAQDAMSTATAALTAASPVKPANTDATAVARYLAALGIVLPVDRLADLISLLTVVAIEVVGSVAFALGRQSLAVAPTARPQWTVDSGPDVNDRATPAPVREESGTSTKLSDQPSPRGGTAVDVEADRRRDRIVQALMTGALVGTQERIADRLGLPKTTMRRIVETDSRMRLSVGPAGSRLELVGA